MTIGLFRAFGFFGFVSLLLWVGALVYIVKAWRDTERKSRLQPRLLVAIGVALLAGLPARSAAYRIASIELDRSEEVARAAATVAAAAMRSGPTVLFAEDTAKVKSSEPEYRQRGLQARSREELAAEDTSASLPALAPVFSEEDDGPVVLRMPEKALYRTHRLNRANRAAAAAVCWLGLILLVVDYLRTFNSPTACHFPLPISGPLLDRLLAKPPVMHVSADALPALLETIIRRGETFLYCGPQADRVIPADHLPRWRLGMHACGWLPRLTSTESETDLEYLLDALWFCRAFVVIPDRETACRLPAALRYYTDIRRVTQARAAHTIYILWDMDDTDDVQGLKELMKSSHELNFHWVMSST